MRGFVTAISVLSAIGSLIVASVICSRSPAAQESKPQVAEGQMKRECKVVVSQDRPNNFTAKDLSPYGDEGWDLASVYGNRVFFKRPKR